MPSGEDLNSYVRAQVTDTSLVVAVISPTFQTRPFCIAELGSAWGKVGNLFPIAVPGMERTDLEGVLDGMVVKYLDDPTALDELHTRVCEAMGHTTDAKTWGRFKAKWLASVADHTAQLPEVEVVLLEEFAHVKNELAGTADALKASEEERRTLERQLEEVSALKNADEVADIRRPDGLVDLFEELRGEAQAAVSALDSIVAEALWYDLYEGGMPWPDAFDDHSRHEAAKSAEREGLLVETSSDLLIPDQDIEAISDTYKTVKALRDMLSETSEEFDNWFRKKYGMSADLSKKMLWDRLIG